MPHRVRVDGEEWALVDEIDVRNRESEDAHLFRIEGTNHSYRERETHRYPGGSGIEGRGYRHEGGSVLFRVGNVMPDTPVVMVRQAWAHGAEHGKVRVDNRPVGAIRETEVDVRSPWRNRAFVIPADAVQREEISLEVDERGSERGLTWFHLWFYQPAEAADAYAAAAAVAGGAPVAYGGARAGPTVSSFSELRTVGRELPGSVIAEGRPWRLADQISFSDHAAVDAHDFRVVDSQGTYVGFKLALRFPDGSSAEEQGIRYDHGEATWQVSGLTPDKDVTLVFRTDVQRGHWAFDLSLDGAAVCRVRVDERDPVHRGRNWDVIVPGRFVTRSTARFRAAVSEPGRGVTFFRIWVYQAE